MSILMIGKRADDKKRSLLMDRLHDLQEVQSFCVLPPCTRAESHSWVSLHVTGTVCNPTSS